MDVDSGLVGQANRQHIDTIRWRLQQLNCKTPEEQEVRLYKNDLTKLAIIELRSGAKNALSGRMISQLTEVLDQLYNWPQGRGVLICGHAGTFCSGSDLMSVRETASQEWGLDLAAVMQYNLRRLQLLPMISVALVEGYALGGGAELACAADMRLMTDSAKIGFVHIKVGVCCGWGGGSRLVQLLGPSRALELLSSGRLVGASEALQLGLSNASIYHSTTQLINHQTTKDNQLKLIKTKQTNNDLNDENHHHNYNHQNGNNNKNSNNHDHMDQTTNTTKTITITTTTTTNNNNNTPTMTPPTSQLISNNNTNHLDNGSLVVANRLNGNGNQWNTTQNNENVNGQQQQQLNINNNNNHHNERTTSTKIEPVFTRSCDVNGNQKGLSGHELELSAERREALQFLCQHTIGNLETIKALKSMINAARFEPLQEALAKEAHLFASTWGKEAHLAALAGNLKHNR